jgi:hypothetical protein
MVEKEEKVAQEEKMKKKEKGIGPPLSVLKDSTE